MCTPSTVHGRATAVRWADNGSPMGGDTAVHVSRDVSVGGWQPGAAHLANRSESIGLLDGVSRAGVCDVGWVIPRASVQECERCEAGGFSWWAGELLSAKCHSCPTGAVCSGGSSVQSSDGWYIPSMQFSVTEQSTLRRVPLLLPCNPTEACSGNNSYQVTSHTVYASGTRCTNGYRGPLCSACMEGYGRSGEQCVPCPGGGTAKLMYMMFKLMFSSFVIVSVWRKLTQSDYSDHRRAVDSGQVKLCFQQLQLLGVIMGAPGVSIPRGLQPVGLLGGMASGTASQAFVSHESLVRECIYTWGH